MVKKNKAKKIVINLATIIIVLILIGILLAIRNNPHPDTSEELTKCMGENSELYTQLGCHACKTQEEIFGENYQYLNVIDCFYERETCAEKEISATPTWIIKGEYYKGVQDIETLQQLTGC